MENKILGYVDGRLKESEQREMEKHLAGVRGVPAARERVSRGGGIAGRAADD